MLKTRPLWVVWILWKQWIALLKARSEKEGSDEENHIAQCSNEELDALQQDYFPRGDSTTQLVAPSAVHQVSFCHTTCDPEDGAVSNFLSFLPARIRRDCQ